MSETSKVLVIDDEPDIRELIQITLGRMNIECDSVDSLQAAQKALTKGQYFLCLADMRLPDGDGIELIATCQHSHENLPIAIITAYGNVEGAVNALKQGAFDYVSKPVDLEILRRLVSTAKQMMHNQLSVDQPQLLGNTPVMLALKDQIGKLARSQAPITIKGGSGSGKELVARAIHELGPRRTGPFVPVNCGAIPSDLMESEFFGHKKGSFTGALADKEGLFQAANGGTLFLDEVADLPLVMQVKLLRAIQERSIRPIGSASEQIVDVRILSASHKDLSKLVAAGEFRRDLFYRINVIECRVPDLDERREDIPLLAHHIIKKITKTQKIPAPTINQSCLRALQTHHFPGNVRELENIIERAIALCDGQQIKLEDCQLSEPANQELTLDDYLNQQEKDLIVRYLNKHQWNRSKAARELGISLRALRYRLKKLEVE